MKKKRRPMPHLCGIKNPEEYSKQLEKCVDHFANELVPVMRLWMRDFARQECDGCAMSVFTTAMISMMYETIDGFTERNHSAELEHLLQNVEKELKRIVNEFLYRDATMP